MRILVIGKMPPIQGGVSSQTYWNARLLAEGGHEVHLVTNASEVEYGYRQLFLPDDIPFVNSVPGLTCHYTEPLRDQSFVPWTIPYASKLFGLAVSIVAQVNPDMIFSWYFEPYAVIAAQIGKLFDIPYVVRSAGSDIGRLSKHKDLANAFHWMLSNASAVLTSTRNPRLLIDLGVEPHIIRRIRTKRIYQDFRNPQVQFPIHETLQVLPDFYAKYNLDADCRQWLTQVNLKPRALSGPVLGIYGKVGRTKGYASLFKALDELASTGIEFSLLALAAGNRKRLEDFISSLRACPNAASRTYVLPPLPPWRIPAYLHTCDIVFCLEHNFPISFHSPITPSEVLASGIALICSAEIACKQPFGKSLVDGKNVTIVEDPSNFLELKKRIVPLIVDRGLRLSSAAHGFTLFETWSQMEAPSNTVADELIRVYQELR